MHREYTELECLQGHYSDLHKDVHGFRPRFNSDEEWNSVDYLRGAIARLDEELVVVMAEDARQEKEAIADFENRVDEVIASGAGDRATALRWIFDAEEDSFTKHDRDHFCWTYRLPFGYFKNEVL